MARQLQCPNCGGSHTLVNPGISMLVCEFCQATVYWSEDQALQLGTQSILPEGDTRLYMGATGTLLGKAYQVVGHVRLEVDRASWDEWYLQIDGKKAAWLSEGGRQLALSRPLKLEEEAPDPEDIQVGFRIKLSGHVFSVREMGQARCVGGEGQLPFTLLPGEQYPYMDIATLDGKHSGTLEYDEEGEPHAYLGQPLTHEQLTVNDERPAVAASHEGKDVDCPNCAAPLEKPSDREVRTLVCSYCGAQLDLSAAQANVMGINSDKVRPNFLLEVGQAGTFAGQRYEVSGRLLYRDNWGFEGREYVLFNPDRGYLWLAEENGHFILSRPTKQAPTTLVFNLEPKYPVKVGDQEFLFYEETSVRIAYVDGALPWLARVSDQFKAATLVAPPKQFGIESDGGEISYFVGDYMTPAEVWKAFGLRGEPWEVKGVHAAQPYIESPSAKGLQWIGLIFAGLNLLLLAWSSLGSGQLVLHAKLTPAEYTQEHLTERFAVEGDGVMHLKLTAPVNNGGDCRRQGSGHRRERR